MIALFIVLYYFALILGLLLAFIFFISSAKSPWYKKMQQYNMLTFSSWLVFLLGLSFLVNSSSGNNLGAFSAFGIIFAGGLGSGAFLLFIFSFYVRNIIKKTDLKVVNQSLLEGDRPEIFLNFKFPFWWIGLPVFKIQLANLYGGQISVRGVTTQNGLSFKLPVVRRGEWQIKLYEVVIQDVFYFFKIRILTDKKVSYKGFSKIPKFLNIRVPNILYKPSYRSENSKMMVLPDEGRDKIRQYSVGDTVRSINWKISAHKGSLYVMVPEERLVTNHKAVCLLDNLILIRPGILKSKIGNKRFHWDSLDFQIYIVQAILAIFQKANFSEIELIYWSKGGWETQKITAKTSSQKISNILTLVKPWISKPGLKKKLQELEETCDILVAVTPRLEPLPAKCIHIFTDLTDLLIKDLELSQEIIGSGRFVKQFEDAGKIELNVDTLQEYYKQYSLDYGNIVKLTYDDKDKNLLQKLERINYAPKSK
jgi:predicted outer membrane lipoprotein